MKKKLQYVQILNVLSVPRRQDRLATTMRQVRYNGEPVPDGCFAASPTGIELPKRKRGQKFIVRYVTVQEKEL